MGLTAEELLVLHKNNVHPSELGRILGVHGDLGRAKIPF